jgi:signal peptidase I
LEKVKHNSLWELGKIVAYTLMIALIIKIFIFTPFIVEGSSMQPTLHNHDRLIVNKAIFHVSDVNRGDVVIIQKVNDPKYYVKRVIGLEGDRIEIHNGVLFVNGKAVKEEYLNKSLKKEYERYLQFGQVEVPKNSFFVMGDNRLNSKDSRNGLDYIQHTEVIGKAEMIYFPFNRLKIVN